MRPFHIPSLTIFARCLIFTSIYVGYVQRIKLKQYTDQDTAMFVVLIWKYESPVLL